MSRLSTRSIASNIVGGSALSFGIRVVGLALGYAAHILLSRLLGLAGYGQYVVALGWAMVLVLPSRLGFDYSALRYATHYLEDGDNRSLRGFVRLSLGTVAALSLLVGAAMVAASATVPNQVGVGVMVGAAALLVPIALLGVVSVIMRVGRKLFASQFYDQVLRPAGLIVAVGAWELLGGERSPVTAMALTASAAWLALAALGVDFRRTFAETWSVPPDFSDRRKWFALSIPLLGVSVAQELLNQLEVILLGSMADVQSAGLFAAAARLVSLMAFALAAFGIVSGPMIASAYQRRDLAELQYITTFTTRLGLLFAIGVALILAVGGKWLLGLFGPDFRMAYAPLLILVAGGLVNAFTGVVVYLATLTGRERPALAIFVAALLVSLALNLLLIPRLGVIGAAIASTTALSFWNIAMLIYVRRTIGIDASVIGLGLRA